MTSEEQEIIKLYRSRIKLICFCLSMMSMLPIHDLLGSFSGVTKLTEMWDGFALIIGGAVLVAAIFLGHAVALLLMSGLPKPLGREEIF